MNISKILRKELTILSMFAVVGGFLMTSASADGENIGFGFIAKDISGFPSGEVFLPWI